MSPTELKLKGLSSRVPFLKPCSSNKPSNRVFCVTPPSLQSLSSFWFISYVITRPMVTPVDTESERFGRRFDTSCVEF